MVDLGTLGGGYSRAVAVNLWGQVVGDSTTPGDTVSHAFSWTKKGGMIDLGTPPGSYSNASAVNTWGQVVGSIFTPGNLGYHAFSWTQQGGMVDLGTLGGGYSEAFAVNDSGQVVGYSGTSGGADHAFSWSRWGGMVDLGTLGGSNSYPGFFGPPFQRTVNIGGQVVGYSNTRGDAGYHAFSWTQEGGMLDLRPLGGTNSIAFAVNDSGQVVGSCDLASGQSHACLWNVVRY